MFCIFVLLVQRVARSHVAERRAREARDQPVHLTAVELSQQILVARLAHVPTPRSEMEQAVWVKDVQDRFVSSVLKK